MVGPVEAATARSERILEAAVQVLDQAITTGVVGGGGDVLSANGGAEGAPDGAAGLRASIRGDGCWHAEPGNPGCHNYNYKACGKRQSRSCYFWTKPEMI